MKKCLVDVILNACYYENVHREMGKGKVLFFRRRITMKKAYIEPRMIVEDFTVSEMVAKCMFITANTFVQQLSSDPTHPCSVAQQKANSEGHGTEFSWLSNIFGGEGDFNNVDADNNWLTNNTGWSGPFETSEPDYTSGGRTVFVKAYHTPGVCDLEADTEGITFMNYDYTAGNPQMSACQADSGSALLQNS